MLSAKVIDNLEKDNKRLKAANWQLKGQHEYLDGDCFPGAVLCLVAQLCLTL